MNTTGTKTCSTVFAFFVSALLLYGAGFYVVPPPDGNDEWAGTSWTNAFATISNAVANAGGANTNIWVSNGVYEVDMEIVIEKEITVIGIGGAEETIVQSTTTCRVFQISNAAAVLDGFTIHKGTLPARNTVGGGVYLLNGTVQNCIISECGNQQTISGGGIYMEDGLVRNCVIRDNNATYTSSKGAGVYMTGGLLQDCSIFGNIMSPSSSSGQGGGVYITGGRIENCLIVSNWGVGTANGGGGGVWMTGGEIVNSTIAGNWARSSPNGGAGVRWDGGGTLTNCIIYHNMNIGSQAKIDISGTAGWSNAFYYSCSPDLTDGVQGNITADPEFADWRNGDFRLPPYSPCVNAGTDSGLASDVDGNPRPRDGRGGEAAAYDMGAYERPDADGYFNCYFQVRTNTAFNALDAVFTASVFGPNTDALYYWWDFGNGTLEGANLAVVTNSYEPGIYTVSLAVSNAAAATTNWVISDYILVGGTNVYVAVDGAHIAPFDTWDKASTSILAAVNAAVVTETDAARVIVSNGTYNIPWPEDSIYIDKGITVISLNGASNTVVWGDKGKTNVYANFDLDHPDAVVDGFTIGNAEFGVYMHKGTVRNCIIRDNVGSVTRRTAPLFDGTQNWIGGRGAGLRLLGGLVENCLIVSNTTSGTSAQGAGLWMGGDSLVRNCIIAHNILGTPSATIRGGGAYVDNGILRNCLVFENMLYTGTTVNSARGGGIALYGGLVESCTVVHNNINRLDNIGAGFYCEGGTILNTIAYYNTLTNAYFDDINGDIARFSYSCAPELTNSEQGNTANAPVFAGLDAGNYRLYKGSPCINTGTNQIWMADAVDLDGKPRIGGRIVDMGAYESPVPVTVFIFY